MAKELTITATIRCPAPTNAAGARAMADAAGDAFSQVVLETCKAASRFAPGTHDRADVARRPRGQRN